MLLRSLAVFFYLSLSLVVSAAADTVNIDVLNAYQDVYGNVLIHGRHENNESFFLGNQRTKEFFEIKKLFGLKTSGNYSLATMLAGRDDQPNRVMTLGVEPNKVIITLEDQKVSLKKMRGHALINLEYKIANKEFNFNLIKQSHQPLFLFHMVDSVKKIFIDEIVYPQTNAEQTIEVLIKETRNGQWQAYKAVAKTLSDSTDEEQETIVKVENGDHILIREKHLVLGGAEVFARYYEKASDQVFELELNSEKSKEHALRAGIDASRFKAAIPLNPCDALFNRSDN